MVYTYIDSFFWEDCFNDGCRAWWNSPCLIILELCSISALYHPRLIQEDEVYAIRRKRYIAFQSDPLQYLSFVKEYSARARAVNPDIRLTVQLSTERPVAPGMTLLETFQTNWTNVKPYLDGVTVWWSNDTSAKNALTDFMEWFNEHGR